MHRVLWPSVDDHGSPVILRSVSVRPTHLFDPISDHDYSFKLPLARERDAHSSARRSSSRHVRYRAVPRANRIPAPSSRAYQQKPTRVEGADIVMQSCEVTLHLDGNGVNQARGYDSPAARYATLCDAC